MLPENLKAPSRAASFTDLAALRKSKKGKTREAIEVLSETEKFVHAYNPWFLDVASPTSEDMRAIGKLLHLHPLTLEDILQQDPREKLERFPKLGYYFISFRAIESRTMGTKIERQIDFGTDTGGDEGPFLESNVYLVVFNEGVCSFHFTDASEHIDRVRNRIISLEKTINMSSDSFFPFSDEIEKEVMAMEQLVYPSEKVVPAKEPLPALNEKNLLRLEGTFSGTRTHFALPRPPLPLLYRRFLRYIRSLWQPSLSNEKSIPSSTMITLRRMARIRRLVTSLTRLLAAKSEVVAQIRKRLLTGSGNGTSVNNDEAEVAMYMGDVQDHILSLQHSLAHYERMLSQSHPTYLQQLRTHVSLTKSGADKALVYLTTVSMAVLCLQTVIGMFSQNVNVPASPDSFHVFGIVISVDLDWLIIESISFILSQRFPRAVQREKPISLTQNFLHYNTTFSSRHKTSITTNL
ncbi:cation transporter [Lentinula edodes]|uniref:Cation transporter n=1 Tax=Lentinula edodes TaxID=5353 RepID=A0A1Q3EFZ4_LENED|nr:cation transporter [Lentinula edodes]